MEFRYIRFHNTILKHIKIYNEDSEGNPVIDFTNFDKAFDKVIGYGYTPFFEIGFCPPPLSQHKGKLLYYGADLSIPKSYEKWNYLIREMIKHIISRYELHKKSREYMDKKEYEDVEIKISEIKSETICKRTFSICDEGGSSYECWQKLGKLDFVNKKILYTLEEKSKMPETGEMITAENGEYVIKTKLRKDDAELIQLHI